MQENQIFKPFDEAQSIDHLSDPVRTMWDIAKAQGSVLKGRGTTFCGVTLPNYFGHFGERDSYAVFSFDNLRKEYCGMLGNSVTTTGKIRMCGSRAGACLPWILQSIPRFRGLLQKGIHAANGR